MDNLRLPSKGRAALVLAAAAAAAVIVVRSASKRPRLVKDLQRVGKQIDLDAESRDESVPAYDVIICGGGTAGCVLAARLSQDPNVKVLMLEAGESGVAEALSRLPAGFGKLMRTDNDYKLFTVPQTDAGGVSVFWPRAKLLGGCSSMNAMMFHNCAPSDFDEWAKENGEQWAWANLEKYFRKFEDFTPHPEYPGVDLKHHGTGGPIKTGFFGNDSEAAKTFLEACEQTGLPKNPDVNNPNHLLGGTKIMTYIDSRKVRSTAESGYLTAEVLARPNLTVAIGAQVSRILFNQDDGVTRAVGVEFGQRGGPLYRAAARKEVIVCGGAVHTPHILKLSGVGPAGELKRWSIPVVADLPGVGDNLIDHPTVKAKFMTHETKDQNAVANEGFESFLALAQYLTTRTGPLTSNLAESAAFLRSDDPKLFPQPEYKRIYDGASSDGAPDLELIAGPTAMEYPPAPKTLAIGAILLRPRSAGSITLVSANPFDQPSIDPRYLSVQTDVDVLARGFKLALRLARAAAYKGWWVKGELDEALLDTESDEELEKIVRQRCNTLYHPMCSARMGPKEKGGVLDPFLRVHGIPNLRVVDASAFPTPPSGHTTAPVLAMAEFASEFIAKSLRQ